VSEGILNLTGKFFEEKWEEEEIDFLSKEEKDKVYDSLTQEQVDQYLHLWIVPKSLMVLMDKYSQDIMFADKRNSRGDGFLMLNTSSSWCMYPVIGKQQAAATREINKAVKAINAAGAGSTAGMASKAFEHTVAAIMSSDSVDHWRCDHESEEDNMKIATKVVKLVKDLLWFTDAELGLVDPHSRKVLMSKLEHSLAKEWEELAQLSKGGSLMKLIKSAKNGQGMGRSLDATPPPAKKAKTSTAAAVPTAAAAQGSPAASQQQAQTYLDAISDKLNLRTKTVLQLKITDLSNEKKSAHVVLSGATCMKKLNQLCGFVTGNDSNFVFHSQKGTSLKGSKIELMLANDAGEKTCCWLAEKGATKKATAAGAGLIVDKTIKVVQAFQGLTMDENSGIVCDSEQSMAMASTPGSLVWVSPDGKRYDISAIAICPQKCVMCSKTPLPRIVTYTGTAKTAFGKGVNASNKLMVGGRQTPQFIVMVRTSNAQLNEMTANNARRPICNEGGTEALTMGKFIAGSFMWKAENVATAGPPVKTIKS
jgi:hypothetical protein